MDANAAEDRPDSAREDDLAELEQRHRDAMLDLVLTWGELDGALSIMLSLIFGFSLHEGAELIERMGAHSKFAEIRKMLKSKPGAEEAAAALKRYQKAYAYHSRPRNLIAHTKCVGTWAHDREYVVFLAFERVEEGLAVYRVPLDEMQRATSWGRAMIDLAHKMAERVEERQAAG